MSLIELALVIEEPGEDRDRMVFSLLNCGLRAICCATLRDARSLLPQADFKVVACKESLVDGDYRSVLREVKNTCPGTPVVVIGRYVDWDTYLAALGAGAFEYIVRPLNPVEAERAICAALGKAWAPETVGAAAA